MKIMITGGSGRLGRELKKVFPSAIAPTHEELDIISYNDVYDFINILRPDKIIHAAALTSIRECEKNKKKAWNINVEGTKNLIDSCTIINPSCYFIYISTPGVFRGDKGNYSEDDLPHPINYYGLTKLLGEFIVKNKIKNWLIIRTNFKDREKWPHPKAFIDRWGTYLFADDLAKAIKQITLKKMTGILHVCGDKKISMFNFAKITTSNILPMTINEYTGPPLTQDMSLISNRIPPFKLT